MKKFRNSNCDETKKMSIVVKIKNLKGYITQKLKWWQNSKTQIVTKLKKKTQILMKLKNLHCNGEKN